MRTLLIAIAVLLALAYTQAFMPKVALPQKSIVSISKSVPFTREGVISFMSVEPDTDEDGRKLTFDNNLRSRKGRTTDEDGKSNIWAYESKEEVEVAKNSNGGLIVLALAIGLFIGALTVLPTIEFPNYD